MGFEITVNSNPVVLKEHYQDLPDPVFQLNSKTLKILKWQRADHGSNSPQKNELDGTRGFLLLLRPRRIVLDDEEVR